MAPYNISLADQRQEIFEKKSKIQDEITINTDLIEFLEEQIDNNSWHLANLPLEYDLVRRGSFEYRQLEKKEKGLRKNQEYSRYEIERLKSENILLKERVKQLDNEIKQLK